MIPDTSISLCQHSLRSPDVPLTCLACKTWLKLQNMKLAKANVRETVLTYEKRKLVPCILN